MSKINSRRLAALVAVASGALLSSSVAMAATTGEVALSGTVASSLSVTATATAGAATLDLDGEGSAAEHIVMVADIAMSTNNEAGLTLSASSGDLTKTDGTPIAYQVTTVDDAATAPVTGAFTVASGTNYTVATAAAGSSAKDLYIKYTPATNQDPGAYGGTISLTVSDN